LVYKVKVMEKDGSKILFELFMEAETEIDARAATREYLVEQGMRCPITVALPANDVEILLARVLVARRVGA
jgi:hypothetical protein